MMTGIDLCSSWMLSLPRYQSGEEELTVLPQHTKVIQQLDKVGMQGVAEKTGTGYGVRAILLRGFRGSSSQQAAKDRNLNRRPTRFHGSTRAAAAGRPAGPSRSDVTCIQVMALGPSQMPASCTISKRVGWHPALTQGCCYSCNFCPILIDLLLPLEGRKLVSMKQAHKCHGSVTGSADSCRAAMDDRWRHFFDTRRPSDPGSGQDSCTSRRGKVELELAARSGQQAAVAFLFDSMGLGESSGSHDTARDSALAELAWKSCCGVVPL